MKTKPILLMTISAVLFCTTATPVFADAAGDKVVEESQKRAREREQAEQKKKDDARVERERKLAEDAAREREVQRRIREEQEKAKKK